MSSYNLDDGIQDDFKFILNGIEYIMKYPTTEDVDQVKTKKMTDQQAMEFMYAFITPVNKESASIQDNLKKTNIKKVGKFNEMIESEFLNVKKDD